jgi:hypothetical protein
MTKSKLSPPIYEPLSEERRRAIDEARWKRNQVKDLPQGFSMSHSGRAGSLYYREGARVIELEAELAGDPSLDLIIFPSGFGSWIDTNTFARAPVAPERQHALRVETEQWLASRHIKFRI